MRLAGHVARMEDRISPVFHTCAVKYPGLEDPREVDQLEDLIVDRIILKMNRSKNGMRMRGLD